MLQMLGEEYSYNEEGDEEEEFGFKKAYLCGNKSFGDEETV